MTDTVAVLGAGMVGVACAIELQRRGYDVTLYDRSAPGRETSYGNAGVIARSSLMPFNHPGLWATLPRLMVNQSAGFRYDPAFIARNLPWAFGFLSRARPSDFEQTTTALDALIRLSTQEHLRLLGEAGATQRLRANGWLFLYRSEAGFAASRLARATYDKFGIDTQTLGPTELSELEPQLKPIFARALWIKDSYSVDDPGRVVEAYAQLFAARGGRIAQAHINTLMRAQSDGGWRLLDAGGTSHAASQVVIALGPWSKAFLAQSLGIDVPMAFERGYHMHYGAEQGAVLQRPVYDTAGAYVLSPMEQGLRLTTGVQLSAHDAPRDTVQLDLAERAARQAFPLGDRLEPQAWLGSRPTLPDCRPIIGACPRQAGLWLAFGHQHIGFSTGTGTAALLGSLMAGESAAIDAAPFRPERFLRA
nr:putative FAD-binding oxidoreductase [uncultured bacterium]